MTLADEFAKILDDEDPWERKDSIDKWKEEGKIAYAWLETDLYLTVEQFGTDYDDDSDIDWDKYEVPDELWNKIEEYAGLTGIDYEEQDNNTREYYYHSGDCYNWDHMYRNDDRLPRLVDIPIDLAIKVCDECGDKDGGNYLRREKEKYGHDTETLEVSEYWSFDTATSTIEFSDGSELEDYDWALE